MIEIFVENINGLVYNKLLEFLLNKCEKVSFAIPNYNTVFDFDNRETIFVDYEKSKVEMNRNSNDYQNYLSNIKFFICKLELELIKQYTSIQYFDQLYNYEVETHIYNYNDDVFKVFKEVDGLYKWLYPNYPEDLYFFSKGKCYFASISHEKECCFFEEDDDIIDLIESLELDYYITSYSEPPLLDIKQSNNG